MNYSPTQGLASLGRNGDSMLVHMNPSEVAGLQGLAMAQGGSLTINPHTGLPEAFNLGEFFTSLLPTLVGGAFGFSGAPLMAGIAAGAATGAVTNRKNPLMGALMGGLGGYGGMGLGDALSKTMAITNPATAASTAGQTAVSGIGSGAIGTTGEIGGANLIGSGIAGGTAGTNAAASNIMGAMRSSGVNIADPIAQDVAKNALNSIPKTSNFSGMNMDPTSSFLKPTVFDASYGASIAQPSGTMGGSTLIGEARNLANSAASAQNPLIAASMSNSPTPGFGETFIDQLGGNSAALKKIGLPLGGAALGGLEESDIYGKPLQRAEAEKYDPYARLDLGSDTGLRLVAKGGYINGYATGGTVQSGGIRDLYGTPDNPPTMSSGLGGFGLGRLNDLANEQARTQAQTYGYADGGDVGGAPSADVAAEIDSSGVDPSLVYGDMVDDSGRLPYTYDRILTRGALDADRISPIEYSPYTYAGATRKRDEMARGGYLNGQGDGMSDSIPATIEGKQPARLADGEFVIPADVVSHLGNGSSKAGSKRLYAMLDKVRRARTGNKKQGKQINPNKYMPA